MAQLRTGFKILLFFSAYTPLFVLLLLKLGSQISQWFQKLPADNSVQPFFYIFPTATESLAFIVLIGVISIPNIVLWGVLRDAKKTKNPLQIEINQIKDMNHIYIGYLMSYVIPFLSFNFVDLFDILSIILLLALVCFIYINSNLLYVNVIFSISGYSLFKIIDSEKNEFRLITENKNLLAGNIISISPVSDESENFFLEVKGGEND